MRRNNRYTEMGKASQQFQTENRLANALNYRPVTSYLVFELCTNNPRNGVKHHLEIKHELHNGNSRYNVYLNGEKWGKQWSRTGFCKWLFKQIDDVVGT